MREIQNSLPSAGHPVGKRDTVNVELPLSLLESLLAEGLLCIAQLRSLDAHSHQSLKKLCLECCAKRVRQERLDSYTEANDNQTASVQVFPFQRSA